MATKLSVGFITLLLSAYTVGSNARLSNIGSDTKLVNIRPISNKDAFIGFNRKNKVESSTPTDLQECKTNKNVVLSKLLDYKYKRLVLVTGTSLVVTATCYKFIQKLVHYFLYSRYVTRPYPKVADTIGHVLLVNTKEVPSASFVDRVVNPLSKLFERMAVVRGFLRPGMKRVSTSSVVDKETYVILYFFNDTINNNLKMMGMDPLTSLRKSTEALKESGKKAVVVFVDMSKSLDSSYDYFRSTAYYAIPFGDSARKRNLSMLFNLNIIPTMVVLDSEGNLVKDKCLNLFYDRIEEFPWRNFKFIDALPEYLVDGSNQPVHKSTLDGKYVGVFLFSRNPNYDKMEKKGLNDLYDYMNRVTDGNFRLITLNFGKDGKLSNDTEGCNRDWLTVNSSDMSHLYTILESINLNYLNRFVLLDNEGKEYISTFNVFNENVNEKVWKEYSKGANRVKGDELSFIHIFKRPIILVLGDGSDGKPLDDLELELNKALSVHENQRTGSKFEMMLIKDSKKCENIRKQLKLDKNAKMFCIDNSNRLTQFKGDDVNQNTVLKFIDDYHNKFKYTG